MSSSSDQLKEIKSLISSSSNSHKSFGYSSLLNFQEQTNANPSSIQALTQNTNCLIASIIADIFDDDEEISVQALKCLGFMIYHPSFVATILEDDASLVLQSLSELVMTTKMKAVCNLGVWCISIQNLEAAFLDAQFQSLLRAVVHALDNPIGSLSTTFEAMQAVIKLATQLSEQMRELSHIWAPPICRRLLSIDKKERDMSERCMLKIKSKIFPPTLALSKALVEDMKIKLLSGMKDLMNQGLKVQTIQAWGWFIRLLGSYVTKKSRHLINEMLKVPELTFPDNNPQVQMASLVAWEGLIDTLIHLPVLNCEINTTNESGLLKVKTLRVNIHDIEENRLPKSIKLIMTPLVGIISSKCELSVRSSCLNTWCYLLHKLGAYINCPQVMKLALDPVLEAVFQIGPCGKNILLWNLCLELLDDFILVKCEDVNRDTNGLVNHDLSARTSMLGPPVSGKCSWKQYPVRWLPWDLSQLDFFINIINIIASHVSTAKLSCEERNLACDAALRIFRSVLKGVKEEFKNMSIDYKDIMLCLNSILKFTRKIFEDIYSEGSGRNDMHHASLLFIEAVTEVLEPSILESPLYKVALDIQFIDNLQSNNDIRYARLLGLYSVSFMDMVSPLVYLMIIYICALVQSTYGTPKMELVLDRSGKYFKFIFSSCHSLEVLLATIGFLYKHRIYIYLQIWMAITKGLIDWIESEKDLSLLKMEFDTIDYQGISHLFSYPFVVCSSLPRNSTTIDARSFLEESNVSSQRKLEIEQVIEVWKSLYGSVSASKLYCPLISFPGGLCSELNRCLDITVMPDCSIEVDSCYKDLDLNFLCLCGEAVICILQHLGSSESSGSAKNIHDIGYNIPSCFNNIVGLAARFMKLSRMKIGEEPLAGPITSRVFSALACFVSCLVLHEQILPFFEIISCPMLQWLSDVEIRDETAKDQLQLLWTEILNSLQRSLPAINFNSSFLKLHACLLEKTLSHSNPFILEPTITFWNSTYSKQNVLDYPQNMLQVLDKLSRKGRINLQTRNQPLLKRCHSEMEDNSAPLRYKVTASHNMSSKRVELVKEMVNPSKQKDKLFSCPRRKRLELTEHQKEVRCAQQGRQMDCSGHGPGIRTYTSVDFSQGNDDSQEVQETPTEVA